jgi:hypothetical protein
MLLKNSATPIEKEFASAGDPENVRQGFFEFPDCVYRESKSERIDDEVRPR